MSSFYLVDDDPVIVELLRTTLEEAGHRVRSSIDSTKALREVRRTPPDCVLIDIMMPGMDGFEMCQAVRQMPETRDVRVIVVSGKAYDFDRRRAMRLGADGFVLKSLGAEEMLRRIEHILEDKIDVTFWGVRGTLPVPGEKSLRYGGNTSCVSMEFSKGNVFIFDGGSGIKALSDHIMKEKRLPLEAKIFISHPHWDHINALPFFVPFYLQGNEFQICGARHGDTTMRELVSAQMDGVYFPITLKEFGARVYFRDLDEEEFYIDDIRVRTKMLSHPGKCLGYRIEYKDRAVCYVTDNELYPEDSPFHNPYYVKRLTEFVQGCKVLITDATYTDEEYHAKAGWGHSAVGQVVTLAHAAAAETLCLFHHDPDQDDDAIDAKLAKARAHLERLGSSTRCIAPAEGDVLRV